MKNRCNIPERFFESEEILKIALAIEEDHISTTLGRTVEFILLDGSRQDRVSCEGKIPLFLQKQQVGTLICNGIGNCMLDLLTAMSIKVIAGISGEPEKVIAEFRRGTLRSGEKYSCADYGRSCGECAGSF